MNNDKQSRSIQFLSSNFLIVQLYLQFLEISVAQNKTSNYFFVYANSYFYKYSKKSWK